jgi:hypothetical protein
MLSTRRGPNPYLDSEHWFGADISAAAGMIDMRPLNALLRTTRSRIGRRLAEIVAIAAASLPAVGA